MRILVVSLGSIGDLLPFIVAGTALRDRGHEVIFASNAGYEALARSAGFEFCAIWDRTNLQQTLDDVLESDPGGAWDRVRRDMFVAATGPAFDFIGRAARNGKCAVMASWSAFGARLAHEKLGLPLCSVYLSPHALLEDSQMPPASHAQANECRLALFPEWFGPPQTGWPADVKMTGFAMFDDASVPGLPPDLERFLEDGVCPVIFTPGSFARRADSFFRESLAVCASMNLKAVFLTPYAAQIPGPLPSNIMHFKYVALQRLLPRAAALVSHGGIGTCAQAMKAGIPQLVAPVFFDQFDNADRVQALGVGKRISAGAYSGGEAAESLLHLLNSAEVRRNCADIAARFRRGNPVREICDVIESLG